MKKITIKLSVDSLERLLAGIMRPLEEEEQLAESQHEKITRLELDLNQAKSDREAYRVERDAHCRTIKSLETTIEDMRSDWVHRM